MTLVKLRNGTEEFSPGVTIVMLTLQSLTEDMEGILALWELRAKSENRNHVFFSEALRARLARVELIDGSDQVHGIVRNVVLSAVVGDAFDFRLVDPRAEA